MKFSKPLLYKGLSLGVGAAAIGGIATANIGSTPIQNLDETSVKNQVAKVQFKKRYSQAFLDTRDNPSEWNTKYDDLKKKNPKYEKLILARSIENKEEAIAKIKEACDDLGELQEGEEVFKDLSDFCLYKNGEVMEGVISSSADFDKLFTTFKGARDDTLSNGFKLIKDSWSDDISTWREKMLKECEKLKTEIYEGTGSTKYKNFKAYCKKS